MKYLNLIFAIGLISFLVSCKQDLHSLNSQDENRIANHQSYKIGNDTTIHRLRINGRETLVNEIKGEYYFAEDLTISPEQFRMLMRLANDGIPTIERATIVQSLSARWPNNTLFYTLPEQGSLTQANHDLYINNIHRAINMIQAQTHVQFIERTTQPEYINFVYSETTNSSPLGWRRNRVNTVRVVNIQSPGIIAHEIMHSMGMRHEQCRPDRDQFLIVMTERAREGSHNNFNIYPGYDGHGPFDFGSIMMYSSFNFAIDPQSPVMTRLDGSTFNRQRNALSSGDYAGINALYPAP
ncbi:M12 family metallopeptidase [Sphingobacterium sp. lm-10]|uniref:M12 family metallopeptidase n=1 Tax=Sphingobacterium sp. lm-10 TaxID=2944904 RepID=UPI00202096F8|nr:M12 family metallopeptidase [Sphingobacterium sp. lm-10]MCL7989193.1 M12 family metallopeptidase [Sphingobacterium sp. lm-10]